MSTHCLPFYVGWPHPLPVLRVIARTLGCEVSAVERAVERRTGRKVRRHADPWDRIQALRGALRVGEAKSILEAVARIKGATP